MPGQTTLDHIVDGSTLKVTGGKIRRRRRKKVDWSEIEGGRGERSLSDHAGHRKYHDASMESTITNPLTRYKALHVKLSRVHTMTHGHEKNRTQGAHRGKYMGKQYTPPVNRTVDRPQPTGCIGPVYCALGKKYHDIVTQFDPHAPVHAAPHTHLTHGGSSFVPDDTSMIGAGGTLPTDNPGDSLNKAVGLHYAVTKGPEDVFKSMARRNMHKGLAAGKGLQPV